MEADILGTRCNKDDVMLYVWLFEKITASFVSIQLIIKKMCTILLHFVMYIGSC